MLKYILIILIPFNMLISADAYKIFDSEGDDLDLEDLIEQSLENEIILFGELHNNPISHFLQIKLLKNIYKEDTSLCIGAEMFEADDQLIINEYLTGKIRMKDLVKEAKTWNNFKTDYSMILEFAEKHNLKFIATNIPRRYASLLARSGEEALEEIDELGKKYICPLPMEYNPELPGYKSMEGMGADHGMPHIAQSQAIKDATMAYFIDKNFSNRFYHLNGAYHSNNFEGINWYLKRINPDYKILTITCVEQENVDDLNEKNFELADFIIVIDSDMTKSY